MAALLAFGASISHGFHFDDYSVIYGPQWTGWQTRPLTWLSFSLNHWIANAPSLWHLVSFAAHVCAVLLLYSVLRELMPPAPALIGAALFAVHPIQAESVAYVFSRASVFSTAFSLGAALLWLRGRRWPAVACFALALLAKEDCVTVPLLFLLLDWSRKRLDRSRLVAIGVMLLLALAEGGRTLLATGHSAGSGAGFSAHISPAQYLLLQGSVVVRYLRLLIVPYGFTIDPAIALSFWPAMAAWVGLVMLAAVCALPRARNYGGLWGIAGLILLIPSSSIFPAADLAADHRMYLPMTCFAAGLGLLLVRTPRLVRITAIVLLILVSAGRMNVWASEADLWSEAVARAPEKLRPRIQLARAVDSQRALEVLREAQQTHPESSEIDAEFGRVYLQTGHPELALAWFGKALGRDPGDPHALNNRGVALRALGQQDAAAEDFRRALKIDPCLADARRNLGYPQCGERPTAK